MFTRLLSLLSLAAASPDAHRITSLPGVDMGQLDASHFSGYLAVQELSVFYYYVQHPDPTAPLLVWMNGGPGASSLMGLFTELGPLLLNSRSFPENNGGDWHLESNPYSWSNNASLLVWEQPAGVGFSRCTPEPCAHLPWNDTSSAEANLQILLEFYSTHPSEVKRDVRIAGESYGGVYVPLLAQLVHEHNNAVDTSTADLRGASATFSKDTDTIPLKGIAVGNGCVGWTVKGGCGLDAMDLLVTVMEQGAPGVSRSVLADVRAGCKGDELTSGKQPEELSATCLPAMNGLLEELAEYNEYSRGTACGPDGSGNWGDGSGFSCGADLALREYLSGVAAQKALHVLPAASAGPALAWKWWDGDSPFYTITNPNIVPTYAALLAEGYGVTIYNGLRDTGVPAQGAERWIATIAAPDSADGRATTGVPAASPRRKWSSPSAGGAGGRFTNSSQVAGYVTRYANGIQFVTVVGAGHLMPGERPASASTLISAVLRGEELPAYDGPKCKRLWLGKGYGNFCANSSAAGSGTAGH